jgi:hypothetical protein
MSSDAIFGFAGVLVGSLVTAVITLHRDTLAARRELLARRDQLAQERASQRDAFQRESILALQTAVTDLIRAAYIELDRMIAELRKGGVWPARRWEHRRQSAGPTRFYGPRRPAPGSSMTCADWPTR